MRQTCLSAGVAAVDTQICAGDVAGRITAQEGDGTHQVFGTAHLALGDQADPLGRELRVVVQNLLCAVVKSVSI